MKSVTRRNILLGLLLTSLAIPAAFAQTITLPAPDAARLLALNVNYTTAKNNALPSMTDQQKAEIDKLEAAARAAAGAGKYGEAMKNVHHAQAVVAGRAWSPLRQLNSSLVAKLSTALPEPGQSVVLKVGQWYEPDEKVTGKLTAFVAVIRGGGIGGRVGSGASNEPTVLKTEEIESGDWLMKPATFTVTVPNLPDGTYSLGVMLRPATPGSDDAEVRAGANMRIVRGAKAKVDALRARVAAMKDADPSAAYRVTLYDSVVAGDITLSRGTDLMAEIAEANAILDEQAKHTDPWAARRGDMRKAYLSKADNTLQPYRLFLPAKYDGTKAYPLVIALHGMGGDENSMFEGYTEGTGGPNVVKKEAEARGYIVACPKGRGTADMYLGQAEQDVTDVLAEVRRVYKIDPQRIYLTGHSMGGYGTWSYSQAHPTIFAALAPISGGGNTAAMTKIASIPQFVTHGDNDKTVPVERSREMVAAAKAAHTEIVYDEVPGGSHVSIAVPAFPKIFAFFDAHVKPKGAE